MQTFNDSKQCHPLNLTLSLPVSSIRVAIFDMPISREREGERDNENKTLCRHIFTPFNAIHYPPFHDAPSTELTDTVNCQMICAPTNGTFCHMEMKLYPLPCLSLSGADNISLPICNNFWSCACLVQLSCRHHILPFCIFASRLIIFVPGCVALPLSHTLSFCAKV